MEKDGCAGLASSILVGSAVEMKAMIYCMDLKLFAHATFLLYIIHATRTGGTVFSWLCVACGCVSYVCLDLTLQVIKTTANQLLLRAQDIRTRPVILHNTDPTPIQIFSLTVLKLYKMS